MKRTMKVLYALAFLAVCAGALAFLHLFTQSESAFLYPAWETGAVVSSAGEERPFDPAALPPELEEGELYCYTLTLPPDRANGTLLIFETTGLEAAVFVDGAELWYSSVSQPPETANQSQAQVALPAGGGERLTMDLRPLSDGAIVPPLLRLSTDPTDQAGAIAYANYYGLPAGASALALVAYLFLHRERAFWKALGAITAWSAGALALAGLVSHLRGGYLAQYLPFLVSQLRAGVWSGTLYWLIWWLVLVCSALSAWDLARFIVRTQGAARALAMKNQLVMDNYRSIEGKLRESARLRHGFSAQVAALDAAVQARDWAGVERCVAAWKRDTSQEQARFTEHIAVNAILQDAASRAKAAGITFEAAVMIPQSLPIPDEDLCALLINLLDNALEGAAHTPEGREKIIRFRMRVDGIFLPILCENTFDGHVETNEKGVVKNTKADPASHGFGLAQMRAVAEKYDSVLSVSWTDERFTVQTAPQFPEKR